MNQKYIIALDTGTSSQRDAITTYLRDKGWKVWHWIGDLWLLADVPPEITARSLWTDLVSLPPKRPAKGLVMSLDDELTHWGGNDPAFWLWMKENWGRPDLSTGQIETSGAGQA